MSPSIFVNFTCQVLFSLKQFIKHLVVRAQFCDFSFDLSRPCVEICSDYIIDAYNEELLVGIIDTTECGVTG